jgi:hypothetical protein
VIIWLLDVGGIDFEETDVAYVGEASNFIYRERLSKYHEMGYESYTSFFKC